MLHFLCLTPTLNVLLPQSKILPTMSLNKLKQEIPIRNLFLEKKTENFLLQLKKQKQKKRNQNGREQRSKQHEQLHPSQLRRCAR